MVNYICLHYCDIKEWRNKMKSILKYPGGKSWLATRSQKLIRELGPKSVAEPFCGGLSFSLNNEFEHVIANDLIPPLINFYRHVQAGGKPNPTDWKLDKEFYLQVRYELNQLTDKGLVTTQAAADMFWYLSMHGFNGLARFNLKGHWNVPMGEYDKIATPDGFGNFQEVTKNWEFVNGSYEDLDLRKVNLIVADPPYAKITKTRTTKKNVFANYSGKGFNFNDQIKVADWLADHDKPIIACNSLNLDLARIYKARGFSVYRTMVPRSISCKGTGRNWEPELLAFRGFGTNRKFSQLVDMADRWRV